MTDENPSSGDSAEDVPPGDMKASHADRDQVVEILRDAAGDGMLTLEELEERVEAAMAARTLADLAALTRDLPVSPAPSDPGTRSAETVEINQRFGTLHRSGSWQVPPRLAIRMHGGDVKLDFTEAVISHDTLDLDVYVSVGGNLILVVKPGIEVATDGLEVRVGEVKNRTTGSDAEVPVTFRVNVTGRIRGGDVVIRYPRRTLGQWMRGETAI
ncbi:DUF1707 SHOCT-like domain-containing protein [Streptomyces sp. URMC 126]|uniref:DUF1707 SHOCT-like domain-containing protein n=1 Tax=Streptomyces sp. URMC 126 TaxID=3423401 RepID=UPI003F1CBFC4